MSENFASEDFAPIPVSEMLAAALKYHPAARLRGQSFAVKIVAVN